MAEMKDCLNRMPWNELNTLNDELVSSWFKPQGGNIPPSVSTITSTSLPPADPVSTTQMPPPEDDAMDLDETPPQGSLGVDDRQKQNVVDETRRSVRPPAGALGQDDSSMNVDEPPTRSLRPRNVKKRKEPPLTDSASPKKNKAKRSRVPSSTLDGDSSDKPYKIYVSKHPHCPLLSSNPETQKLRQSTLDLQSSPIVSSSSIFHPTS